MIDSDAIMQSNFLICQNIMEIEKCPQNSVYLIKNWHLTDSLVYESIFQ